MKLTSANALALAAFLQVAQADFALMVQGIGGNGISGNVWGWQVYDDVPACGHTTDWIWESSKDVSGGKYGVRCKGDDDACVANGDATKIQELEMNFHTDALHFTAYANRGWGLFDLNGNQIGSCNAIPNGQQYDCGNAVGQTVGQYMVHCATSATADEIKSHRP